MTVLCSLVISETERRRKYSWRQVTCLSRSRCWSDKSQMWEHHPTEGEGEVAQSCPTLCDPVDCSPPGSSVHWILQARILEWVAISFSKGSSRPRDQTLVSHVSCTGRQILYCKRHLESLIYTHILGRIIYQKIFRRFKMTMTFRLCYWTNCITDIRKFAHVNITPPSWVIASLVAQRLKHLPPMWETWVRSLGREDPLEKEMATHSSILAWRIPWTEEPGGLQSTGSQRVRHD